uniref:Uncharacterized protein n=1 Tax=Meloidogyne enterolobii TaxID=390850 RepID=A0A6V7VR36_MELEN|nr:unnamed protein product [Meloidogyne enterolobii]
MSAQSSEYKDNWTRFEFFLPPIVYSFVGFIRILFNTSVCYITIKYRKQYSTLKTNTAILLTINSFFEILHQSGHFIYLIIAVNGINLIQLNKIILFQIHSIIGMFSAVFLFNSLSFDRFLGVAFPIL